MIDLRQYEQARDRLTVKRDRGELTEIEYKRAFDSVNRAEARAKRNHAEKLARAEAARNAKIARVSNRLLRRQLHRSISRYEEPSL